MLNINLNKYNIKKEKYLIVGCSAGPDSMALLHYLNNNTNSNIVCAHVNHNVRKESNEEEEYLKKYCLTNKIIFESITIKNYKENNFENEARTKRYNFYTNIIKKYNSNFLFLAHHGDDLIETILMKIIRGSNIEGYAGIKEIAKYNNYHIIRPLLKYTKEDLITYNNINNIKYYIDKSNYNIKYTRNRIRKNILPLLKQEQKDIHIKFYNYSKTLLEYNNYIDKLVNNIIKKIYINNYINIDKFNKLDTFLKKNVLYKHLNNIYNNKPNIIKEKNINDILKLINNNKPNIYINLPKNKICIKEYNKIYIKEKKDYKDFKLIFKDIIETDNYIIKKINNTEENGNDICRLNSNKIKLPLYITNKQKGDYIEVLGLNGKKKIKDIFIDKKIPKEKRDTYPILKDSNNNILWIPNIKKSKFNTKKNEFCDIILKYCEKEENNE